LTIHFDRFNVRCDGYGNIYTSQDQNLKNI
jgi:hypothetical protein